MNKASLTNTEENSISSDISGKDSSNVSAGNNMSDEKITIRKRKKSMR